jgi:hypothetical protein
LTSSLLSENVQQLYNVVKAANLMEEQDNSCEKQWQTQLGGNDLSSRKSVSRDQRRGW